MPNFFNGFSVCLLMLAAAEGFACELEGQWASKVIGFSSQYSAESWAAKQTLGPCDEPDFKDSQKTWNAQGQDKGLEWIEVEFPEAVYPSGIIVRETFAPGSIRKIELKLLDGSYVTAWQGTTYQFLPNKVNDSRFLWETGGDLSNTVKLTIDTSFTKAKYESIDSIQLLGPPTID